MEKQQHQMPFIHLNGTSLQGLQQEADAAYRALDEFISAWARMEPNPRDYYPEEGAWYRVREEREELNQKIADLHNYIEELREYLHGHV